MLFVGGVPLVLPLWHQLGMPDLYGASFKIIRDLVEVLRKLPKGRAQFM